LIAEGWEACELGAKLACLKKKKKAFLAEKGVAGGGKEGTCTLLVINGLKLRIIVACVWFIFMERYENNDGFNDALTFQNLTRGERIKGRMSK